ncbi:MAG: polysaccharide pyruvyl transferase CsaB [Chitinophagales bacterium]
MRALLSGYYGLGNAGDEAVLAAIVEGLRARDPGGAITVLSADPALTQRVHGVRAVPRMSVRALLDELSHADLLISGGGSLLQDVTSLRSLLYYLGVIVLARLKRVPVFFYAQGIGPLRRPLARWLTARVADRAAAITVRDAASAQLLRQLGVARPAVTVTADPVFTLVHPVNEAEGEPGVACDAHRRPAFGFAFRPWPGADRWLPAVAAAAGEAARRCGAEVVWLPFQAPGDVEVAERLQAACPEPSRLGTAAPDPREVARQVAACDLVVGARLHALIMGAAAGRPVVGVSYDPKVEALLGELGLSPAARLPGVDMRVLAEAIVAAWEGRRPLVAALSPRVAELRRRAEVTVDLALAAARPGARPAPAPVAPPAPAPATSGGRSVVLGVAVDRVTLAESVERVRGWVAARRAGECPVRQVVTLNPEMVMRARRDPGFSALLKNADLVTADGVGVVWAAGRLGEPLPGRVTGVDLAAALMEEGAREGWRFYFLGSQPGVAEEAARVAQTRYPGLVVVGTRHGYFGPAEEAQVVDELRRAAPDIMLVALGSPKQEAFIARHRERLGAAAAIGVGGTLDVLAGRVRRAPVWMRRVGLEWLYRLAREPRRLGRAMDIPRFMWAVFRATGK